MNLVHIPAEIQVHILSYLRAYDLSDVQKTCKFYNNPDLLHSVVACAAIHVYTPDFTQEIKPKGIYTLEHLRNMELSVVAHVLSLPEPKTGFYVSKCWVRKTLLWLEKVNEPPKKKLTKKQQRQRARRLSDVSPPWPNVNSDILCSHQHLARCSAKSARARRRLLDKQAWKILRKLFPDSTQLDSVSGECLQCLMETEIARKAEQDRVEEAKQERKRPLSSPHVRSFYTRARGVPAHRLVANPAPGACPLLCGEYVIIPRGWCHRWRRYVKTGEGNMPLPPESSALLCDAHRFALLPPHLEAYLSGETSHLMSSTRVADTISSPIVPPRASFTNVPVGVRPDVDPATVNALMAAGVSHTELATQQMAMLQLEQNQQPQTPTPARHESTNNELLDRENHVVVEVVTKEEWIALQETGCWPRQLSWEASFVVTDGGKFSFPTLPCRECDPTGSRFTASAEVKYRRKRWEPKSVEQKRVTKLEY